VTAARSWLLRDSLPGTLSAWHRTTRKPRRWEFPGRPCGPSSDSTTSAAARCAAMHATSCSRITRTSVRRTSNKLGSSSKTRSGHCDGEIVGRPLISRGFSRAGSRSSSRSSMRGLGPTTFRTTSSSARAGGTTSSSSARSPRVSIPRTCVSSGRTSSRRRHQPSYCRCPRSRSSRLPAATFAFRYDFGTWSLKQPVALSEWVPFRSVPPGPGQVLVRRRGSMGRGHAPPDPRVACVTDDVTELATTAPVAWSSLGRGDGKHTDLLCQLAIDDHERVPLHHVSPNTSPFGIRGPCLGEPGDQPERCAPLG